MSKTRSRWTFYREIKGRPHLLRAALGRADRRHYSARGVYVYSA